VSGIDEQALSRRLHQELGALPAPAAPVGAVIRRGAARRTRRWVATASGLAAVAAVAGAVPLLSSHTPARPGREIRVSHTVPSGTTGTPSQPAAPVLTGTMFAAGTAQGRPWQLSVRNIADPGAHCLPAIMLNATDGYLPPLDGGVAASNATGGQLPPADAGVAGGIASLAFLTNAPGQPGTGYAALRVSTDVTRLTVGLRDGRTLALRPVPVWACGRWLPLAGFSYPGSGVATITAYAGTQVLTRVAPPASLFTGAGSYAAPGTPGSAGSTLRLVPGVWQQLWRTQSTGSSGLVASGVVASGRLGGTRWRISVQLGAAGDCFLGATFDGHVATQAADCMPISVPPAGGVTMQRFVLQQRAQLTGYARLTGYAGLASPRAAYLVARLSDGRSVRVQPAQVGGRRYAAFAVPANRTVTKVTVYDGAGVALSIVKFTTAAS
jgi:hypothetical protein